METTFVGKCKWEFVDIQSVIGERLVWKCIGNKWRPWSNWTKWLITTADGRGIVMYLRRPHVFSSRYSVQCGQFGGSMFDQPSVRLPIARSFSMWTTFLDSDDGTRIASYKFTPGMPITLANGKEISVPGIERDPTIADKAGPIMRSDRYKHWIQIERNIDGAEALLAFLIRALVTGG